ncbi:hypothetical protein N7513_007498 [Penicillium frequentans]|nr:hypothetical protein N7513_007498 [Penicillium glabrum]
MPDSPLEGVSSGVIQAMSLTSMALGTCQTIAAYQNNLPIMIAAVPGRLLAAFVFHRSGGGWPPGPPYDEVPSTTSVPWAYGLPQPTRTPRNPTVPEEICCLYVNQQVEQQEQDLILCSFGPF